MSVEPSPSPTPSLSISDAVMVDGPKPVHREGTSAVLPATASQFAEILHTLAALGYAIGPNSSACLPSSIIILI
jgi:hypothetical protein